ncbi:unknown [Clostridium sp. CAG:58]|nr:unknown [Clostridium sp. CAG:58]
MDRSHCVHVLFCDHVPAHGIAYQLFQLHPDVFHIIPGALQEVFHHRTADLSSVPAQDPGGPPHELGRILLIELRRVAQLLYPFIEPVPLIHLALGKDQTGGIRHLGQVRRQLLLGALKKAAAVHQDQPPVCKKRHGIRQADDLLHIWVFSLKIVEVHGIAAGDGLPQLLFIAAHQKRLVPPEQIDLFFPVEQIDLFKGFLFYILIQCLHGILPSSSYWPGCSRTPVTV